MRLTLIVLVISAIAASADASDFRAATLRPVAAAQLPGVLMEVSGLAPANDSTVFAHNDEQATIYEIDISSGDAIRTLAIGRPPLTGDFEAIVAGDGAIAVLTSEGLIFEATLSARRRPLKYSAADTGLKGDCEVEGFARSSGGYYLACKQAKRRLVIFEWSKAKGARKIIDRKLDRIVPNPDDFRATDLVYDPAAGALLVLDSAAGAILEVSLKTERALYWRLGGDHPQAEGLALLDDGRLVVADEGKTGDGSLGRGRLTVYPPRR